MRKVLYIDLDGVVVDYAGSYNQLINPEIEKAEQGYFLNMLPIEGAVESVKELMNCGLYEVYFLSTAPWRNPYSLMEKRIWIEQYFGEEAYKRLILTHRKDLCVGDYLIDDRTKNGAGEFKGELLQYGTDAYPNWERVLSYLI